MLRYLLLGDNESESSEEVVWSAPCGVEEQEQSCGQRRLHRVCLQFRTRQQELRTESNGDGDRSTGNTLTTQQPSQVTCSHVGWLACAVRYIV